MADVEHGCEAGVYDNMRRNADGSGGIRIRCLCGWTTDACDTWEEAGADFDDHLAQTE